MGSGSLAERWSGGTLPGKPRPTAESDPRPIPTCRCPWSCRGGVSRPAPRVPATSPNPYLEPRSSTPPRTPEPLHDHSPYHPRPLGHPRPRHPRPHHRLHPRRRHPRDRRIRRRHDRPRPRDPRPRHHPRHPRRHQHGQLHRRAQLHHGPALPGDAAQDGGRRAGRGLVRRLHRPGPAHRGGLRGRLRERHRQVRRHPPPGRGIRPRPDRAGAHLRRRAPDRGLGQAGRHDRRRERLPAGDRHLAGRGVPRPRRPLHVARAHRPEPALRRALGRAGRQLDAQRPQRDGPRGGRRNEPARAS